MMQLLFCLVFSVLSPAGATPGCTSRGCAGSPRQVSLLQQQAERSAAAAPVELREHAAALEKHGHESQRSSPTASIATAMGRLTHSGSDAAGNLAALVDVEKITSTLASQAGNATKYFSDGDKELLEGIIGVIQTTMYAEMTNSHEAEQRVLDAAAASVRQCNSEISARLAGTGDLGNMSARADGAHGAAKTAEEQVAADTQTRDESRSVLKTFKRGVPASPDCTSLPTSELDGPWDAYFESHTVVDWYQQQQAAYAAKREVVTLAELKLTASVSEHEKAVVRLKEDYCSWKLALTAGCDSFDRCYENSEKALEGLREQAEQDISVRLDAFQAGENIISRVRFLLGSGPLVDSVDVHKSLYANLRVPEIPEPATCDRSVLLEQRWESVSCAEHCVVEVAEEVDRVITPFRDTWNGNWPAMSAENVCVFLGYSTAGATARSTRYTVTREYAPELFCDYDSHHSYIKSTQKVTKNGVTFCLTEFNAADSEPLWGSVECCNVPEAEQEANGEEFVDDEPEEPAAAEAEEEVAVGEGEDESAAAAADGEAVAAGTGPAEAVAA